MELLKLPGRRRIANKGFLRKESERREMEKEMISVDRWSEISQVYFLTHLHADHTKGLSSNWSKGPIFCSPITAKLFPVKFPGFRVSLIRVLEIGSFQSLSLLSPTTGLKTNVQVIAIDAHHCPGAVMYLFRGEFGCRLYTGDFRWEPTSERALLGKSMLLKALSGDKLEYLYLDNTYCNPYYSFPPREVVARQVVNIIASHPLHDVIIAINTLGKEDLLVHIAQALKTKIWVWPERLQTMHLLGYQDTFTTNTSLTRVRAVPFYSFSVDTLEALNTIRPTIGIMPSGLPWVKPLEENDSSTRSLPILSVGLDGRVKIDHTTATQQDGKSSSVRKFHRYIYTVPYSDHSCFNEIQEFVQLVQPSNMKGIVSSSSCNIDPVYYFRNIREPNEQTKPSHQNSSHREKVNDKFRIKTSAGCHKINNARIKNDRTIKMNAGYVGVRMSRVSVLRRRSSGAKIVDIQGMD